MTLHRLARRGVRAGPHAWAALAVISALTAAPELTPPVQATQQVQERMPVFSAGVELVVFNVAVLDKQGRPLTDLTVDDFRLRQAGVDQQISLFATPEASPLDIALVIDASGSIRQNAPRVREDAMNFLAALGPRDCVYFVPFQGGVGESVWAAPDDPLLAARIGGMSLEGGTALYDALGTGIRNVQRRRPWTTASQAAGGGPDTFHGVNCGASLPPPSVGGPDAVRRTALVVLSDGGDEHSVAGYVDTLGAVWASPVPVFAVAIGDAVPPEARRMLRPGSRRARTVRARRELAASLAGRLGYIAHISGGRLIVGEESEALSVAFDEVVAMLRSSYLVGYRPPEGPEATARNGLTWNPVMVEVQRRDAEVFARPGFYETSVDTRGAERLVVESLGDLEGGSPATALARLDTAAQLDPGYWPTYLQRARAYRLVGDLTAARDDLLRGLNLRPGTVPMHRLLAETAYALQEYPLAWQQAIYAYQGGALVATLMRAIEEVAEPPETLDTQLRATRAFVDIGATVDGLDQGTLESLLRALRTVVQEAPDLANISPWNGADVGIILDVHKVEGTPRRLEGEFILTYAPYMSWEDENVRIDDVDDPAAVAAGLRKALEKVRDIINDLR